MTHLNLADPTEDHVREFTRLVTELALEDHRAGKLREGRRSGRSMCARFCTNWRKGHTRLASTIYNKIAWTFEVADDA